MSSEFWSEVFWPLFFGVVLPIVFYALMGGGGSEKRSMPSMKVAMGIDYHVYIQSQEWRQRANEAKQRAGHCCQVCNRSSSEVTLDAHHRTYDRLGDERPEDITVLCRDCHQLYEKNKKYQSRSGTTLKSHGLGGRILTVVFWIYVLLCLPVFLSVLILGIYQGLNKNPTSETSVITHTPLAEVVTAIPTPTPIPSTPMPGFVSGEEEAAYTSFIKFYEEEIIDCTWDIYTSTDLAYFLSTKDYHGRAVYIGNSIWRFYLRVGVTDVLSVDHETTYREEVVEWRSLPDRTWEDKCSRNLYPDVYGNYTDDTPYNEYYPEPRQEEYFDEPPPEDYYDEPPPEDY